MRQAFIQDSENDIDRYQSSQKQQRLRANRLLESPHVAGEIRVDGIREMHFRDSLLECRSSILNRRVLRQIVSDGHRRKLALVVDDQRSDPTFDGRYSR